MKRALVLLALVACGDNAVPHGSFEIVGHSDLGARGMSSALAIAGDYAYVGSRIDHQPVLIVDIADPSHPEVVGEIGAPDEALGGMSSRELRAAGDLLVVLNLQCSPTLHGCDAGAAEVENLKFFDISNRRAPALLGTYPVTSSSRLAPRSPHEFFLWRDPQDPAHVLVYLAAPGVPSLEIIDASTGVPMSVATWDPYAQGGVPKGGENNILHSLSVTDDGTLAYLSHQTSGLFVLDLTSMTMLTPPQNALHFGVMGPHSVVQVPGTKLAIATEEVYPPPFGAGCPWGHLHVVDLADPVQPTSVGEYQLPENDCAADAPMTAFTAHNATVTHDLALVTWYAGGLQAIDISDPTNPTRLAELRPEPLPQVAFEDPGLGGNKVEMWSYPVIRDGLIYVVDVRNGLYVLRYHGRWQDEVRAAGFAEGNSNL